MEWGSWHCAGDRDQDHPHGKEMQKNKMAVWGGLIYSCEEKRGKKQRRKKRYKHLNAKFQRIARRNKKAFFSDQCTETEEKNRMGKTRDLFKKIRDTRRKWQPTPIFLPGESLGQRSLVVHSITQNWTWLKRLFSAICKSSPDSHFAFLHFFSMGMVLIPVSCAMSQTWFRSSSGTLSIRSRPLNLFLTSTV